MSFVGELLSDPGIPLAVRQQAIARAFADPGIPVALHSSTKSFWLKHPHPTLSNAQSAVLPDEAHVVIIGSGISGTSISRTILEGSTASPPPKVVVLEARDTCSGATGRNGGHILETADEYGDFVDNFGLEAGRKIMAFRLAHLNEILGLVDQLDLAEETQARKVQFLTAYFDDETWEDALVRLGRFKEGMPVESSEWISYEGKKIPKVWGISISIICIRLTWFTGVPFADSQRSHYRSRWGRMALQVGDERAESPPAQISWSSAGGDQHSRDVHRFV